jgi:ribosomal protein L13
VKSVGIAAAATTLDTGSMASITRRSIMVVEARMRMIARNSTNLIEVLVVGMVSRRERDSRRDVRNMAVEAGLAVDLKAEREF